MSTRKLAIFVIVLAAIVAGPVRAAEPERVVCQHILISFEGRQEGKNITRSKKEAKKLAYEIFDRAVAGAEFDDLVQEYTDDSYPGIFKLANSGQPVLAGERKRADLVGKFGDTAFRLEVGEVGIAVYNSYTSPFGWHIIKRLE